MKRYDEWWDVREDFLYPHVDVLRSFKDHSHFDKSQEHFQLDCRDDQEQLIAHYRFEDEGSLWSVSVKLESIENLSAIEQQAPWITENLENVPEFDSIEDDVDQYNRAEDPKLFETRDLKQNLFKSNDCRNANDVIYQKLVSQFKDKSPLKINNSFKNTSLKQPKKASINPSKFLNVTNHRQLSKLEQTTKPI